MSNIKEIKRKILSISSVIKTTEAMKTISFIKLRKSKKLLSHINKYSSSIEQLFQHIIGDKENLNKNRYFFSYKYNKKNKLFIVITSDRGLCGSFNSLIFDKICKIIQKEETCLFFSIGKKGLDFLSRRYAAMYEYNKNKSFDYKGISIFVKKLIEDFLSQKISSIYLIYNRIKRSLFQEIIVEKILPIDIQIKEKTSKYNYFILETSKKEILDHLIPKLMSVKLFKSLLESHTSEHAARMISMHKSTENAYAIQHNLMLNYNKERQTTITKEILEIIGGLEALNK
ncbi:MAG: ATP synthase F1 subunit gamma [Flavobacteriales bacterium]|jgi:F-type H+-transporting ATPase subunit gamma|uniref:ATP synthase F1 subunit gamma n=1 Tax=Blattabacterium sp. (Mastotermes darwiniensis) TaxID=39768 RepID=UPI000231DE17|nr:ATP synthase F1 subunit gamma [Blattabacterium sp. (Mastotermes darwiniensis)]AER40587.1 ATP synthase F1, gamma subunit [Blattabacterium sp. (Mastotermes darwiniensis) str. MADAR]MDR1805084.1 ATP synthase F1 subunit gamma [Flavobacteriales bacterium]